MGEVTTVIDAGGRYGIHPSWKGFGGELSYFAFEPDREEAFRLGTKYRSNPEYHIVPKALGRVCSTTTINVLKHHGQSSVYMLNRSSKWFRSRATEGELESTYQAQVETIDSFCECNGIALDFIKSDTEGSELALLEGGETQLTENVLGVRCEVFFDETLESVPLFDQIFNYLRRLGFFLVNISYDGRGTPQNFLCVGQRYGILTATDAVFLKHFEHCCSNSEQDQGIANIFLKYSAFCLRNNATDVAIEALLYARETYGINYSLLPKSRLSQHHDILLQRTINELRRIPGDSFNKAKDIYRNL